MRVVTAGNRRTLSTNSALRAIALQSPSKTKKEH